MVRQGHFMAVMVSFLIGCIVVLVVGASGVKAQARCEGTRTTKGVDAPGLTFITNDLPGCPKGGLLSGTDGKDNLYGGNGEDNVRGLGGSDQLQGGVGNDVLYGGPDKDWKCIGLVDE